MMRCRVCFTFTPTHSNRVAAALSSYTNIPTEEGQKSIYPLLLTILPPPFCTLRGCIGAEKSIPPHFPSSLPLPPPFSHNCTHTQIGTLAHIQTELTRSTAVHEVTNWGLCLLKGGGEPLLCTHTHRSIQLHCWQVSLHTRQCTLLPRFKRRNMVLPLWEVESFSSLTE